MVKDFSAELQEFIDSASGPIKPGESALERVEHVVAELSDVAGRLVDDLDAENRIAELPALKSQLEAALRKVFDSLQLGPFARAALMSVLPVVVPLVVDAAATKSDVASTARDAYVVPAIDYAVRFLLRVRKGVAPDAPPLSLSDEVDDGPNEEGQDDSGGGQGPTAGGAAP